MQFLIQEFFQTLKYATVKPIFKKYNKILTQFLYQQMHFDYSLH